MSHFIARILQKGPTLRLEFVGGAVRELDLEPESKRGPAFAQLTDPEYVKAVKIVWDGYMLEWPDGTTWGADNIWKRSKPVPESTARVPLATQPAETRRSTKRTDKARVR